MRQAKNPSLFGLVVLCSLAACSDEYYDVETVSVEADTYQCTPVANQGTSLTQIDCVSLSVEFDREVQGKIIQEDLLSIHLSGMGLSFRVDKGLGKPLCDKAPWNSSNPPAVVGFEFHYMGDSGQPEFWVDCDGQTVKKEAYLYSSTPILPWPKSGTIEYRVGLKKSQWYDQRVYTYLEGSFDL